MPAKTKTELLAVTRKEYEKLGQAIKTIGPDAALAKHEDVSSIKDVIAHRAHWIELFFGWYVDDIEGHLIAFPAPGYKWNDLKRYNADLRARQVDMDWATAKADLAIWYRRLVEFIEGLDDDDLYGGPMPGARNAWTTGRWAEAAGASHFRSATKFVRKIRKGAAS